MVPCSTDSVPRMRSSTRQTPSVIAVLIGSPARLAGRLALVGAAATIAAGLWWSPLSPAALDRPAAKAASGDTAGAVADYVALSESIAPAAVREDAAWRAARLAAVAPGARDDAELLLFRFLEAWPDSVHAPAAHVQLATLAQAQADRTPEAVAHLGQALAAAPDHPDAGRWRLQAARLRLDLADRDGALAELHAATAHAPQAARAWLGIGRLRIRDDAAAAYDAYQHALDAAVSPPEARLARLGMATALEQLEGREAALAEVDEALATEGADPGLTRRRERLQAAR